MHPPPPRLAVVAAANHPCGPCIPLRLPACLQTKEPLYIPATIFLVTDHLFHLLVKNYMRRDKASGGCCPQACALPGNKHRTPRRSVPKRGVTVAVPAAMHGSQALLEATAALCCCSAQAEWQSGTPRRCVAFQHPPAHIRSHTCAPPILPLLLAGTDEDRWTRSVYRLHATIFQGYRDWCRHVDLPERVPELTMEALLKGGEAVVSWLPGAGGWRAQLALAAAAPCCCSCCCLLLSVWPVLGRRGRLACLPA